MSAELLGWQSLGSRVLASGRSYLAWFPAPMQFPTHAQWWSNLRTQRLQAADRGQ